MKMLTLALTCLIATSSFANDKMDSTAKKTVESFMLKIANSSGLNIKSNWDKLSVDLKSCANQDTIKSLLNSENEELFNQSLMKTMEISASAQTMIRLSGPKIINSTDIGSEAKIIIKPYNSASVTFETTCSEKEVNGWLGKKSIISCEVTGLEFEQ